MYNRCPSCQSKLLWLVCNSNYNTINDDVYEMGKWIFMLDSKGADKFWKDITGISDGFDQQIKISTSANVNIMKGNHIAGVYQQNPIKYTHVSDGLVSMICSLTGYTEPVPFYGGNNMIPLGDAMCWYVYGKGIVDMPPDCSEWTMNIEHSWGIFPNDLTSIVPRIL